MIDSSALIAILQDEPERPVFVRKLAQDPVRLISAANWLETAIVIDDRFGEAGARDLKLLLIEAAVEIVPVTAAQAELARTAYRRFGRGNHTAKLNYGDCFAYALAQETGEPFLFKGNDFGLTDIGVA